MISKVNFEISWKVNHEIFINDEDLEAASYNDTNEVNKHLLEHLVPLLPPSITTCCKPAPTMLGTIVDPTGTSLLPIHERNHRYVLYLHLRAWSRALNCQNLITGTCIDEACTNGQWLADLCPTMAIIYKVVMLGLNSVSKVSGTCPKFHISLTVLKWTGCCSSETNLFCNFLTFFVDISQNIFSGL